MSRSYRKSPFMGVTCARSEKDDKRVANRRLRRVVVNSIRNEKEMPLTREISNVWLFSKDGRQMITDKNSRWLRK
jgi:hypothetical protein